MDYFALIVTIALGALSGIIAGLLGYAKSIIPLWMKGMKIEEFDYHKISQTIILGVIVGGYSAYKGISLVMGEALFWEFLEMSGLSLVFDFIVKIFARWLKGRAENKKKSKKKSKKDKEEEE